MVGVGSIKGSCPAEFMRKNVPSVRIPDAIIERLNVAPKGKKAEEGKKICIEMIQQAMEIEGVSGAHIMAYKLEHQVPDIVNGAGL